MKDDKKLKNIFLRISVLLFIFSLTQKCYCTTSTCGDSIIAFLLGWFAILTGGAGISWIANPLLLAAWINLKKNLKVSMLLSMSATLMSLSCLLFDSIIDNEKGLKKEIIAYRAGYWLWVASAAMMLVGTYILMLRYNSRKLSERKQHQGVNYTH